MRKYLTIHTPADHRYHRTGEWREDTLLSILAGHAERHGDRVSLVGDGMELTHAEALRAVRRIAGHLTDRGIGAGDPVVVQLANGPLFALANIACSAAGGVLVPTPLGLGPSELAAVLDRIDPVLVVTDAADRGQDDVLAVYRRHGVPLLEREELRSIVEDPAVPGWDVADSTTSADDILDLMFTSGTTGAPKGILNTTNSKFSALRPFVEAFALGPDDAWLVVLPMTHNGGWLYGYLAALQSGAPSYFQQRFVPAETLRLFREHGIREVFLTPTHAVDLLDAVQAGEEPPTTLRHVFLGASDASPELKQRIREVLGAEPVSLYGATENQAATFVPPGTPRELADTTVGRACPGVEVAVFGGEDRSEQLPPGEVGEVGTRGPNTFAGYYDDQVQTFAAFNRDGWYFAGDRGYLDEHGYLHLRGRSKELIIRGGRNIVPADVEDVLSDHPLVERVAAVGLPDERLGEVVCAVVIPRGDGPHLEDLVEHLRRKEIGSYLWPQALLQVDDFPRTDAGKVKRRDLREAALAAARDGRLEVAG